jgi:hypothetical protein
MIRATFAQIALLGAGALHLAGSARSALARREIALVGIFALRGELPARLVGFAFFEACSVAAKIAALAREAAALLRVT